MALWNRASEHPGNDDDECTPVEMSRQTRWMNGQLDRVTLADGSVYVVRRANLSEAKALLAAQKAAERRLALSATDALAQPVAVGAAAEGAATLPLADDEARRLAEEFAHLLTDEAGTSKGYVLSIACQRLVVRDLERIAAVIREGLDTRDAYQTRWSLGEL
ncbi:MAG TPA: hypothetical protein VKC57_18140, partial [Ktedonobacterales bacterium]|nr:hypothetical protein [Ktedonobacterales bacterium]